MKKTITLLTVLMVSFLVFANTANADYYKDQRTLKYGMSNNEVINLQNDLKQLGYFNYYKSTGYFGSLTKSAVVNYQRDNNLWMDGIVGRNTSREIKADKVLQLAKSYQGVPYVWGGVSPSGFDCSGFTHYVLLKNGIIIPRTASAQYNEGTWVNKSQLKQGDLVFFSTYKPGPSHVGIYLGGGKFIHASSTAGKITISDLGNSYYTEHYIGAKRMV